MTSGKFWQQTILTAVIVSAPLAVLAQGVQFSQSDFQIFVAGYVDTPSNYAADPQVRGVYDDVLKGGITWKSFATDEDLAKALSNGDVQVGVGQSLSSWLASIKGGQPAKVLGLSSSEAVPCFATTDLLELLKSKEEKPITIAIGGDWAKGNVFKQLEILGIDKSSVEIVTNAGADPLADKPDIDCASNSLNGIDYKPLLTDEQRDTLYAAATGLITAAPDADFDISQFLIADDRAKAYANANWAIGGKALAIDIPSIGEQNKVGFSSTFLLRAEAVGLDQTNTLILKPFLNAAPLESLGAGATAVKLLFGTDRGWSPGDDGKLQPNTSRAETLSFGSMIVTVPLIHRPGKIEERQFFWDNQNDTSRFFTLRNLTQLSEMDFASEAAAMAKAGEDYSGHALIFVHGYSSPFNTAAYRLAQIVYDINFDGLPILYSWPSKGDGLAYVPDYNASENAAYYFADFVRNVSRAQGVKQVDVICHSMGCRTVLTGLNLVMTDQQVADGTTPPPVKELVIASPDVDAIMFKRQVQRLAAARIGMTLYASAADWALGLSKEAAGGYPRAGDLIDNEPVIAQALESIDVTSLGENFRIETDLFQHSDYAQEPPLMNDIGVLLLKGTRPPTDRTRLYKMVAGKDGSYWRY